MTVMEFDWDSANLEHIAAHGITPDEAEEAVLIEPLGVDIQETEAEDSPRRDGVQNDETAAAVVL